jgi:hypothetical protein
MDIKRSSLASREQEAAVINIHYLYELFALHISVDMGAV